MSTPSEGRNPVARIIGTLADRIAALRAYRRTLSQLSVLTDRELNDIGITRSQIHSVAESVRERRAA